MVEALERSGARVLFESPSDRAPFRIVFEAPDGERMGICAYAFLANRRLTSNRPANERRFQLKYGSRDGEYHTLWQDPTGLYTTLLVGIDPEDGFFVGADPVLHSPTRMFISIEFKDSHAEDAKAGWTVWERERRNREDVKEVLVGGTPTDFLQYVRFERAATGLDQGHRMLLAETLELLPSRDDAGLSVPLPDTERLHTLESEFRLDAHAILDLVQSAPRLKMAVRGWVAESHLERLLEATPGVTDCLRLEQDGRPDFMLKYRGSDWLSIECKNVLGKTNAAGLPRVDFQKTRVSQSNKCSRYYRPKDFDILAASLHPITKSWEFNFQLTRRLGSHRTCEGRLASNVVVDGAWATLAPDILEAARYTRR